MHRHVVTGEAERSTLLGSRDSRITKARITACAPKQEESFIYVRPTHPILGREERARSSPLIASRIERGISRRLSASPHSFHDHSRRTGSLRTEATVATALAAFGYCSAASASQRNDALTIACASSLQAIGESISIVLQLVERVSWSGPSASNVNAARGGRCSAGADVRAPRCHVPRAHISLSTLEMWQRPCTLCWNVKPTAPVSDVRTSGICDA